MISRRILPWRTAVSLAAMNSRCQLIASSVCGFSSWKQRAAKRAKSLRNNASYSARVRSSIIGFSFLAVQPDFQLLDDLLVRRREGGGLGRCRLALAFDVEYEFGGAPIALGRLVDELLGDGLAFADFSPPAILVDDDQLAERVAQHPLQVLRAGRPAARIAGLAFLETGLARRFAMAHLVVGLPVRRQWRIRRHWRPPACGRGRQNCGRSWHDARCRWLAPASDGRSYRQRPGRACCRRSVGSASCCGGAGWRGPA